MNSDVELWIPRELGTEQLMRQINKYNCEYTIRVVAGTIRFSCDDEELFNRIREHTPQAREIYIVR
jgi:hypothetical protein